MRSPHPYALPWPIPLMWACSADAGSVTVPVTVMPTRWRVTLPVCGLCPVAGGIGVVVMVWMWTHGRRVVTQFGEEGDAPAAGGDVRVDDPGDADVSGGVNGVWGGGGDRAVWEVVDGCVVADVDPGWSWCAP